MNEGNRAGVGQVEQCPMEVGLVMEVSEGIKRNPSPRAGSEGTEERPTEV